MTTQILINGAHGKMGKIACETIEALAEFSLVGKAGRDDDLAKKIHECKPEIVIDFTTPDVVYENTRIILANKVKAFIGTTGLSREQLEALAKFSKEQNTAALIAPNISLSAMLLMQFSKQASKYFSQATIIEIHQLEKKDAPSGTALRTAELIQEGRHLPTPKHHSIEKLPGVLGAQYGDVSIHALRLQGEMAQEKVIFNGIGESLILEQKTTSRDAYRAGIALGLEKLLTLDRFVYGLDELL